MIIVRNKELYKEKIGFLFVFIRFFGGFGMWGYVLVEDRVNLRIVYLYNGLVSYIFFVFCL